jgi:aspartate aminotransferase
MLSKKARSLKPSPTLAIAAKAKELSAQGHSVISLSVGEPDWDTFPSVKAAGIHAIEAGQTKYAPSNGTPQLRTAIAHQTSKLLGVEYKPTEVTVSAGAKFIIFAALQMLCDPGDEVLIPAPYWVSYPTMAELVDGVPVIVHSDELTGFKVHAHHIEKKISAKSKVLLLNSPSNPTG